MMLICANSSILFQHLRSGRCSTSFVAIALKDGGFNLLKQMAMGLLWMLHTLRLEQSSTSRRRAGAGPAAPQLQRLAVGGSARCSGNSSSSTPRLRRRRRRRRHYRCCGCCRRGRRGASRPGGWRRRSGRARCRMRCGTLAVAPAASYRGSRRQGAALLLLLLRFRSAEPPPTEVAQAAVPMVE